MIQEIAKNIYTFNVSLPNTALKQLNVYVIKGEDRNVIFDTGYNLPESKTDLLQGIKELGLEVKDFDLVLTHLHSDHTGLASLFEEAGCNIYAGKIDGDLLNQMATESYWDHFSDRHAYYATEKGQFSREDNPGYALRLGRKLDYIELKIGELFQVGEYTFKVMDLKGHTPGHIGLYDAENGQIFSADTVLDPITPNITYWGEDYPNILGSYLDTLRSLIQLDLKVMYATHRKIIDNPRQRMEDLIQHHYERLQEILDAMNPEESYTVEDVSAKITWRVKVKSWSDFPKSQKFFATGETMSHLDYLVHSGHVEQRVEDETYYFTKVKDQLF
ncbi:MBL fold metallo-hydrolase [Facklamia lactis]|uniref:MBL fold metallo-hydrolase n=1 Tax=Facklamia lactis TaxID=2749967 RepID=UPI0018CE61C7|nr:MBL fold metallo-hydrolase [Facklamia lactis]